MVIGVVNNKWGVWKSTICQNLAVFFAMDWQRVCLIDTDVNQSSLHWYNMRTKYTPNVAVFYAPTRNILSQIITEIKVLYDLILIDGTPSNFELNNKITDLSSLLIIPILPSYADTIVTKKMLWWIQKYNSNKGRLLPIYFLINQATKSNNTKEVLIRLWHMNVPILSNQLKSKVIYKRAYEQWKTLIELWNKEMLGVFNEVKQKARRIELLSKLKEF